MEVVSEGASSRQWITTKTLLTFCLRVIHSHDLSDARLLHGRTSDGEVRVEDVESLFAHQ